MKNYPQVYVHNSLEAAQTYCKAFGAELTLEMKTPAGDQYEHCVMSVDGEGILALAEARTDYDVEYIHREKLQTMRGAVVDPLGSLPWSSCCATVIDRYGVCWWIAI